MLDFAKTILLSGFSRIQPVIRLGIDIKSSDFSLKSASGYCALGCLGLLTHQMSRKAPNNNISGGVIMGAAMFGTLYFWLDANEKKNPEKTPNTGSDGIEQAKDLQSSKMETLNETISKGKELEQSSRMMVGDLIRYGGINLIFSPTGEGKSILVTQMGIDIASGNPTQLVADDHFQHKPMDVILYDEEQDEDDITERYGRNGQRYPENLKRIESCMFDDDIKLTDDISKHVNELKSDVCVIIDNLTSIIPMLSGNKVRKFYKRLKQIQKKAKGQRRRVTFIIVAHTIKGYSDKFTLQDLAGSANISNFLNRAIVLMPTKYGEQVKMLKIVKNRDNLKGDATIIKISTAPYIHFEYQRSVSIEEAAPADIKKDIAKFLNDNTESPQKKGTPNCSKEELRKKVISMSKQGMTGKDIAEKLGIYPMAVSRILNPSNKHPGNNNAIEEAR